MQMRLDWQKINRHQQLASVMITKQRHRVVRPTHNIKQALTCLGCGIFRAVVVRGACVCVCYVPAMHATQSHHTHTRVSRRLAWRASNKVPRAISARYSHAHASGAQLDWLNIVVFKQILHETSARFDICSVNSQAIKPGTAAQSHYRAPNECECVWTFLCNNTAQLQALTHAPYRVQ